MSDTFITADEHYGHKNIITFCNRPFSSTEEMRETLIERHNKKVPNKKSYLTIHAGDMFWQTLTESEASEIMDRLNGRHAFLFGNHDELMERSPLTRGWFEWVRGTNKENTSHSIHFDKHLIVISHFAQRVWQSSHKGSWHVFGHSHQELEPLGRSFDIGVEGHNYEPWSLEEIARRMATLSSHHIITPYNAWPGKTAPPCETCGDKRSCLDCLRAERSRPEPLCDATRCKIGCQVMPLDHAGSPKFPNWGRDGTRKD
jgi:calcineurin-like phosphoesterase family protein